MRGATAVTDSHQTAQTHFIDASGVSLAYRRIGPPLGIPLVMLQRLSWMDSPMNIPSFCSTAAESAAAVERRPMT